MQQTFEHSFVLLAECKNQHSSQLQCPLSSFLEIQSLSTSCSIVILWNLSIVVTHQPKIFGLTFIQRGGWNKLDLLHSGHVKLQCVWPCYTGSRMLFKPCCCMCIMEREVETSVVDRQCCYQSQGCPLIVMNAVVEATLLLKRRSEGFGKGKKRRRRQRERTPLRRCVSFQVLALL